MNSYDQQLIRKIRTTIGVALNEPTEIQLSAIKRHLKEIQDGGRTPGFEDLKTAVLKYCRKGPLIILDSVDNSDLNTVLMLALQATPSSK